MSENIRVMIPEEELHRRIEEVAAELNKRYEGKEVLLISVLRGAVFFTCDLAKLLTCPLKMDFMCVSSYGSGTESSGRVKIVKDLEDSVEGKHVLIAEDIIDSGNTLSKLIKVLQVRKPASITLCTLLDKPDRRVVNLESDYTCFKIPDKFVVGYGLDYDQKYRNLPYIGELVITED